MKEVIRTEGKQQFEILCYPRFMHSNMGQCKSGVKLSSQPAFFSRTAVLFKLGPTLFFLLHGAPKYSKNIFSFKIYIHSTFEECG